MAWQVQYLRQTSRRHTLLPEGYKQEVSAFSSHLNSRADLILCLAVWINSSNDADIRVPFGGYKQSGIGHELGEMGILAYTTCKAVHVNLMGKL